MVIMPQKVTQLYKNMFTNLLKLIEKFIEKSSKALLMKISVSVL